MLPVNSMFFATGLFSLVLGLVHLWIPEIVRYRLAIGEDGSRSPLGPIGRGPLRYQLRRRDLIGITWVMSNAASYVLISIGVLELGWALGREADASRPLAAWIAGWWAVRAVSQHALGWRRMDLVVAAGFWLLCALHLATAVGLIA
jgi:hypothetical protein